MIFDNDATRHAATTSAADAACYPAGARARAESRARATAIARRAARGPAGRAAGPGYDAADAGLDSRTSRRRQEGLKRGDHHHAGRTAGHPGHASSRGDWTARCGGINSPDGVIGRAVAFQALSACAVRVPRFATNCSGIGPRGLRVGPRPRPRLSAWPRRAGSPGARPRQLTSLREAHRCAPVEASTSVAAAAAAPRPARGRRPTEVAAQAKPKARCAWPGRRRPVRRAGRRRGLQALHRSGPVRAVLRAGQADAGISMAELAKLWMVSRTRSHQFKLREGRSSTTATFIGEDVKFSFHWGQGLEVLHVELREVVVVGPTGAPCTSRGPTTTFDGTHGDRAGWIVPKTSNRWERRPQEAPRRGWSDKFAVSEIRRRAGDGATRAYARYCLGQAPGRQERHRIIDDPHGHAQSAARWTPRICSMSGGPRRSSSSNPKPGLRRDRHFFFDFLDQWIRSRRGPTSCVRQAGELCHRPQALSEAETLGASS